MPDDMSQTYVQKRDISRLKDIFFFFKDTLETSYISILNFSSEY